MRRRKAILLCFLAFMLVPISFEPIGSGPLSAAAAAQGEEPYFTNLDLFKGGTEGYNTFRIPSLLTTKSGTVLAFAEGRKNSAADNGDIDLVLKRSLDQGRTWRPLQVVCDAGPDTCGNPTPVQDESTGRIWLFVTQNYGPDTYGAIVNGTSRGVRTIWSVYSDDEGATWSQPVNRFSEVQDPGTRWDGTGPGIGIQLQQGPAKGRLVIPAIDRNIQSDDHGATWYQSGRLPAGLGEPTVAELSDGTLMRNDRLSSHQEIRRRGLSTSRDQGATWSPISYDPVLLDPICEASLIRYEPADPSSRIVLFSNPADTMVRENMTVRVSYDDAQTWPTAKTVYKGPSAYSSLSVLPDGKVALLFEGGEYTPYDKIMFAVFNFAWFQTPEADLDDVQFSDGSLTPKFRGDITDYQLALYSGTEQLSVIPVTANDAISIEVNGEPAEAGKPKTITLGGSEAIAIKARLGERTRSYTIHLDRNRPVPELLLHWTFDQTEADGIPDTSGKGHTGLMSSGADLRPGLDGNALYLNGARANVQMTNVEDLHPEADNFTFSVWVNPEALVQQRHIIYWYGLAGKYPQWWCAVEKNGAVRMNLFGMPAGKEVGVATAGGLVKTGVWTHLTFVRDGSVNKIYVNGELATTSVQYDGPSMNVTNRSAPPLLGYDKGAAANRDWLGSMDELRMYKYALNDADIRRLYGSLDETKPVTEVTTDPGEPDGTNGWYTSDVTVTLSATDNLSEVARTGYRLNGGEWKAYQGPFAVTAEGENKLDYRSMDRAGQLEETRSLTLRIDKTAPSLTIEPDPAGLWPPNGKWVPVRAAVDAADGVSGVASVMLVSITSSETEGRMPAEDIREADFGTDDREFLLRAVRNGEGTGRVYTIEYKATDLAGNTASGTAAVTVRHDQSGKP